MTCTSEGAADIYIEPQLSPRLAIVCGFTPVAAAFTALARGAGFSVRRILDRDELARQAATMRIAARNAFRRTCRTSRPRRRTAAVAVVASAGHYDEQTLDALMRVAAFVRRPHVEPQTRDRCF